ncbi:palmitoyltransferase ZDHHC3-like [Lineus longissimus]|uniref:palmitoyltransferase ZDHHC3-like n=1 Tax=Lineus longissimus TaxID=88925 RepID=UPI002B4D3803
MVVFRTDPCGIVCVLITYISVLYADYVVIRHLVMPTLSDTLWGSINALGFNSVLFLLIFSHMRAVLSDPGIIPLPDTDIDFSDIHSGQKKVEKGGDEWTVCMKCETYRPPRAHHCRICRRCIRRMDHHCPWINNCVGEYNQKFFIQFLFYTGLASLYAISLVVVSWILDPMGEKSKEAKHMRIVHTIILVIECIMFGLFVIAIGCDQMQAVLHDETAVEHIQRKGPRKAKRPKISLLADVFGNGPMYTWLCPFYTHPIGPPGPSSTHVV